MRYSTIKTALIVIGVGLVAVGCAPQQHYYWGHYEDAVYVSTVDAGSLTPNKQIDILKGDAQKANAKHMLLPPGFHAHLGYLYYQVGDMQNARIEFEAEKAQFPESTVLMDRMLGNLAKK